MVLAVMTSASATAIRESVLYANNNLIGIVKQTSPSVARTSKIEYYYYLTDFMDNVRDVVKEGTPDKDTLMQDYLPFGRENPVISVENEKGYFKYKSMLYDSLANQYIIGGRSYQPDNGRFLQPALDFSAYTPQSYNPYSAFMNNPFKTISLEKFAPKFNIPESPKAVHSSAKVAPKMISMNSHILNIKTPTIKPFITSRLQFELPSVTPGPIEKFHIPQTHIRMRLVEEFRTFKFENNPATVIYGQGTNYIGATKNALKNAGMDSSNAATWYFNNQVYFPGGRPAGRYTGLAIGKDAKSTWDLKAVKDTSTTVVLPVMVQSTATYTSKVRTKLVVDVFDEKGNLLASDVIDTSEWRDLPSAATIVTDTKPLTAVLSFGEAKSYKLPTTPYGSVGVRINTGQPVKYHLKLNKGK